MGARNSGEVGQVTRPPRSTGVKEEGGVGCANIYARERTCIAALAVEQLPCSRRRPWDRCLKLYMIGSFLRCHNFIIRITRITYFLKKELLYSYHILTTAGRVEYFASLLSLCSKQECVSLRYKRRKTKITKQCV